MSRQLTIDGLTIRLPNGWQGDPTLLARQVADAIRRQAADLSTAERLDIRLQGPFGGSAQQLAEQLGRQLQEKGREASSPAGTSPASRRHGP
jgi:hypothetical protein